MTTFIDCRGCGKQTPDLTPTLDPVIDLPDDGICENCFPLFLAWKAPETVKVKLVAGMCHPLAVDAWLASRGAA